MTERVTSDNLLLSETTSATEFATGCKFSNSERQLDLVAAYVDAALAPNSKRAYASDWEHFVKWGASIPATAEQVAAYLAENAAYLSVATLQRRLISIARVHREHALPDPVATNLVRATLSGIKRVHGIKQKQALPLNPETLHVALKDLGRSLPELRDRALLLLGFAGALRRSEIVSLNADDVEPTQNGLRLHIRRSKTDPFGAGRAVKLGMSRLESQAIDAMLGWLSAAGLTSGPAFRRIARNGRIGEQRLSGETVALILRKRLSVAQRNGARFSPHSLRAGYVTYSALLGTPLWRIKLTTGHKSDASVQRYIRPAEPWG